MFFFSWNILFEMDRMVALDDPYGSYYSAVPDDTTIADGLESLTLKEKVNYLTINTHV